MALIYRGGGTAGMGDVKSFLKGAVGQFNPNVSLKLPAINASTGAAVGRSVLSAGKNVAGNALRNLLLGNKSAPGPMPQRTTASYTPWLIGGGVALAGVFLLMRRHT